MKHQALFSLKDKIKKKLKCSLLHFLFGTLWVKEIECQTVHYYAINQL